jgi:hypothetical protein
VNAIQTRSFVTGGGRSFRREHAVRCFAQTGPPSSCLVAEETRLHRMIDGSWVLEAWNYGEDGVDRWFRPVTAERASWWLRVNGFEDETVSTALPVWNGREPRGGGFVAAASVAADWLSSLGTELEDVG